MLIILLIFILVSLHKVSNNFVSLLSVPTVVLNTVFSGVTCFAKSNTPYWLPTSWEPFLFSYFKPLINNLKI